MPNKPLSVEPVKATRPITYHTSSQPNFTCSPFYPGTQSVLFAQCKMNKQARRKAAIINVAPSEISPAVESIANDVDLLTEILLWLPAKSTIRFKIVSKHWLALLSDSQFARDHCSRNPRPSISGLYFYFENTLSSVSLQGGHRNLPSVSLPKSKIRVTHSCNGLLLCYISSTHHYSPQYIVCNPTTSKYTLPPKPVGLVRHLGAYLAFDPSKSPHHYKVILFGYDPCQIDIYSPMTLPPDFYFTYVYVQLSLNPFFPSLYPVLGKMTRKASNKRRKAVLTLTPSEISPAAELIANNVDLLTEILLQLPAKSTIRLKRVSKHWLSLLSDSQFATNHSTRNPRPSSISGLYFNIQETLTFVSLHGPRHNLPSLSFLDGLRERSTIEVAHSCNGLLLCYINGIHDIFPQYIVCNPTTKKYTLLPKPDGHRLVYGWSGCLVFDPSKSPHHYKVVIVDFSPGPYGPYQIDVYSSESLCWEKKFSIRQNFFGHGVFWNGAIHWLTRDNFLVTFDVDGEEIIAMPNPQSPKSLFRHQMMYFGECGGGLILIQYRSYCPGGLRILELERDYSSWVVQCRVNLRPLIAAFPEMESSRKYFYHGFKVLCAVKGENERGFALLLAIPGRIVSYNPKKKTWDVLRDLVPRESNAFCLNSYAVPFSETFFPV
ncbi:hypothetical protein RHSIM_Rhsim01G0013600 [Rhododendron simsii]|uniref:F-box domain-containing protein n=1 Tax=Rhododendron simsii TaxID=118357 RepID=A0A834HIS3_RHOSS|nr:hypothetical protein RHSIM_Rhsim01G0013600 [Rhododendron simsii]